VVVWRSVVVSASLDGTVRFWPLHGAALPGTAPPAANMLEDDEDDPELLALMNA
jgi:hypothetical protein